MPQTTPFDQIWNLVASFLIGTALAVFLYLTTGVFGLFEKEPGKLADGNVVAIAYLGSIVMSAGLIALGLVGRLALRAKDGPVDPPWPRYRPIEDKEGRRNRALAWLSLLAVTLIPTGSLIACLEKYVQKSRIALWDAQKPLGEDFISSRLAALSQNCSGSSACLRMHVEHGSPEWFLISDIGLLVLLSAAVLVWLQNALAILKQGKNPKTPQA